MSCMRSPRLAVYFSLGALLSAQSGTSLQVVSELGTLMSTQDVGHALTESRGRIASLDDSGYLWVAKTEDNKEMSTYIGRLIAALDLEVVNRGGFLGMVPFYSGQRSMQSYFALKQELLAIAAMAGGWLKDRKPQTTEFIQNGKEFTGVNAPLDEVGYQIIAKQKNHHSMKRFIRRTVKELGYFIGDEGGLSGFVPFFSGEIGVQNFSQLRLEIVYTVKQPDGWCTSGNAAVLSESGYKMVVHIKNGHEMLLFTKRLGNHLGCQIKDDQTFADGFNKHTSLFESKTFDWLVGAVRKACNISAVSAEYGSMHDVVGKGGVLQLRLKNSTRYKYSEKELNLAGIRPTQFDAVNAKTASAAELKLACPLATDPEANGICKKQQKKLGLPADFGETPGCTSKVEQAITDSHRQALLSALHRTESEWTAIIEDDVVPLHPGYFDAAFNKTWEQVPQWAKLVRLSWCTFEKDLGAIRKKTYANTSPFRLIHDMSWFDADANSRRYYTGGCTTGYMVHRSFIPELLGIFPCCCPIDCCMERQLFYAPTKPIRIDGKFRGEQIMINMDAWDSKEDSFNYTKFYQGGVFAQDNRELSSSRPEWNAADTW